MLRSTLLVAVGVALALANSAQGQFRRCPYNATAQIQLYTSMRPQMNMNQYLVNNQMRYLNTQRNFAPVRAFSTPRPTSYVAQRRSTSVRTTGQPVLQSRNVTTARRTMTVTTTRVGGTIPRGSGGIGRPPGTVGRLQTTVQRKTTTVRQNTNVTTVRKTHNVSRQTQTVARKTHDVARKTQPGRQNTYVTTQRKTSCERRKEMVGRLNPNVQVRVGVTVTCGTCHQCPGQTGSRGPRPDTRLVVGPQPVRPTVGPGPRPGPIAVRPTPTPRPPAITTTGPKTPPAVARRPTPPRPALTVWSVRPSRPVGQVPVTQPPALPPLTAVGRRSVTSLLTEPPEPTVARGGRPTREPGAERPTAEGRPRSQLSATRPSQQILSPTAPPRPGIDAAIGRLNPLLDADPLSTLAAPAADPAPVDPDALHRPPPLIPLVAAAGLERTLLPTLADDRGDLDGPAPATPDLGLALLPPALPPLPAALPR